MMKSVVVEDADEFLGLLKITEEQFAAEGRFLAVERYTTAELAPFPLQP